MTKFKVTFEDGVFKTITANYIKSEIVQGWWSYDNDGKEKYSYGEKKKVVQLGETMFFHVLTKNIEVGTTLKLQLFDYDYFINGYYDAFNIDTKKFPEDNVVLYATVQEVPKDSELDGDGLATVKIEMNTNWEDVIADDHDDSFSYDHNIELYFKASVKNKVGYEHSKDIPLSTLDYLRVTYNDQDLFVKPAVSGSSLPEYYDKNGKLIIFAFKRAKDIAKGLNPNAAIEKFIVTKIKVVETHTLSEINKVKRELYYERINLTTNDSKRMLYVTEEASEFYVKGKASFTDVTNTEIKKAKKFSQYFNKKDASDIATVGLKEGREILRFLDYVNVTKTMMSMFPQEGDIGLGVPKPSSAASMITTFATGELTWALSGALSSLFMVADIIATQEVNAIMNDVRQYNFELLQRAKLGGLYKLKLFLDTTITDTLIGFRLETDIPESTHCKVLNGEIKTFTELEESKDSEIDSEVFYSYLVQTIDNESTERTTFVIDSIYQQ